jgi:hypothetical protein
MVHIDKIINYSINEPLTPTAIAATIFSDDLDHQPARAE